MKALVVSLGVATSFLVGCASTETGTVTQYPDGPTVYGLNDQPQTSVSGSGSLMPGAYGTRPLQTGQFTGRERTNDQVGQRPDLPREADPRELARSDEGTAGLGTGAGDLGQTGIVPGQPVTRETIMETAAPPIAAPAHVAVTPPPSRKEREQVAAEGIGAAPGSAEGSGSSTNNPAPAKPKPTPDH